MLEQQQAAKAGEQDGGGSVIRTLRVWFAHAAALVSSMVPGLLSIGINPAGVGAGGAGYVQGMAVFVILLCAISVIVFVNCLNAKRYVYLLPCCIVCAGCLYFTAQNAFSIRAETVERTGLRRVDAILLRGEIEGLARRETLIGERINWASPGTVEAEIKAKKLSVTFSNTGGCSIEPNRMKQSSRAYCSELNLLAIKLADAKDLAELSLQLQRKKADLKRGGSEGGEANPTVKELSSFFGISEEAAKRWQIGSLPVALIVCETFGGALVLYLLMPAPLLRREEEALVTAPAARPGVMTPVDPEQFVLEFLAARLQAAAGENALTTDVHKAYEQHCHGAGQTPLSIIKFTPLVVAAGFKKDRVRDVGTCYLNVKLLPAVRLASSKGE